MIVKYSEDLTTSEGYIDLINLKDLLNNLHEEILELASRVEAMEIKEIKGKLDDLRSSEKD